MDVAVLDLDPGHDATDAAESLSKRFAIGAKGLALIVRDPKPDESLDDIIPLAP